MVRHTDADEDRIAIDTHEAAVDAIQSDDVTEGDGITVKYTDTSGDDRTESGTIVDTEVVEAGTVHGEEPRTWETKTTFYRVTYAVDGKNDHTLTGEFGGGAPTVYTEVGGRHGNGGDRRTIGHATTTTVTPATDDTDDGVDEAAFDAITGEHGDDDFADTVEVVGTRDVDRQYDDDVVTTAVLRYDVTDPVGKTWEHTINAVRIGCPDCKQNTTALIRPDGSYECACGYSNDLTRGTLFYQQTEVGGVWEPY